MQMKTQHTDARKNTSSHWWLVIGHVRSIYILDTGEPPSQGLALCSVDHLGQGLENVDILNLWERILMISISILQFAGNLLIVSVNSWLFVCVVYWSDQGNYGYLFVPLSFLLCTISETQSPCVAQADLELVILLSYPLSDRI